MTCLLPTARTSASQYHLTAQNAGFTDIAGGWGWGRAGKAQCLRARQRLVPTPRSSLFSFLLFLFPAFPPFLACLPFPLIFCQSDSLQYLF